MNKIQKFQQHLAEQGKELSIDEAKIFVEGIEECKRLMREEIAENPAVAENWVYPTEQEKLEHIEELKESGVEFTKEEYDELLDVLRHLYERL